MSHVESTTPVKAGHIKIYRADDESVVYYEDHNVICSTTSLLFSRLLGGNQGVKSGVWGLVIGNGAVSIGNESAVTFRPVNEIKRVPLMSTVVVDDTGVQVTDRITDRRRFLTKINVTTQGIVGAINELGLFGGGKSDTDMTTAPFLDPNNQGVDPSASVILINYKTLPNFTIPPDIDLIFSWELRV